MLGDPAGGDALFPLVYAELRRVAGRYLARERAAHTLQPTALVHEAFLKLGGDGRFEDRDHFLRTAARAMRRVLCDHARARRARKRGGEAARITLSEVVQALGLRDVRVLQIDEALEDLARIDEPLARIVELRFFAALTSDEAARALGTSTRTLERGWRTARAWLRDRLGAGGGDGP
ncbi:MAG TPA: ECF-type sigma factor [Planctomycetota bacterium]|nr:ECF-type sigma factor [Planctomycetota bacterium]